MKRDILLVFVTIFFIFTESFGQKNNYKINGTITNGYNGYIYLSYENQTDSTLVKNNTFTFEGSVNYPIEARFHTKNGFFSDYFFLENSDMKIDFLVKKNTVSIKSIEGNKTHILMTDFIDFYNKNKNAPNLSKIEFNKKLFDKLNSIITQNPKNQFCGMALSNIAMGRTLSIEQIENLASKLDESTQSKNDMKSIQRSIEKMRNINIGSPVKNFCFSDKDDNPICIQDYKNQYLLIDFWASGCAACRVNNRELTKIYSKFKDLGFEILGISLDTDKKIWLQSSEMDGITWKNTIAKNQFKDKGVIAFGIQYIPYNYLIDKDGKIIAININPKDLNEKLTELLGK